MSNTAKDTHKITNYECIRLARIKDNQEKMKSFGVEANDFRHEAIFFV